MVLLVHMVKFITERLNAGKKKKATTGIILNMFSSEPTIANIEIEDEKDVTVTWSEAEAKSSNGSIKYRLDRS